MIVVPLRSLPTGAGIRRPRLSCAITVGLARPSVWPEFSGAMAETASGFNGTVCFEASTGETSAATGDGASASVFGAVSVVLAVGTPQPGQNKSADLKDAPHSEHRRKISG